MLLGVFVTAFYSFRLVFMTFHGEERFHADEHHKPHESPWVVTLPLILLAIPSLVIGWITVEPVLFGDYFGDAISVLPAHDVLGHVKERIPRPGAVRAARVHGPAGVSRRRSACSRRGSCTSSVRSFPAQIAARVSPLYKLLANKFYFDELYQAVFAGGSRGLGTALWRVGDVALIDGAMVNGSARVVGWLSGRAAPHAVGLSVSLRVRDDHRIVRAARVVRAAVTRIERYAVGLADTQRPHLAAHRGRRAHARARRPQRIALGRWVALLTTAATFGISTLLWTHFDTSTRADAVRGAARLDPGASIRRTRWASTASRCR